ncbi:MarR family transcriptional regulator [Arthrobacter sp.]|uniref:MarR family winged helix-turn-helix transcriptional regulator n=1 Tax=Arthrobacter sp. TaxID=1667 RepID=UPI003393A71D
MKQHTDRLMLLLQQFVVESERYVEAVSERDALHRTDLNALAAMVRAAAAGRTLTPGLLRTELHLSSPATTALVDRLDRSGHVNRTRSDTDRRKVYLELTDKARATGGAMFAPLARNIGQVLDGYPAEDRQRLAGFLDDIIAATSAACLEVAGRDEDPDGDGNPGGHADPGGGAATRTRGVDK